MAKKIKQQPDDRKCGDCAHGEWIEQHANKDHRGRYICLRCPFSKRARIRDERVCDQYKPKQ